jgi:tRNA modification GTPase
MDVDTIVSLSTAPGVGAIAIVRMSGPAAPDVLERLSEEGLTPPVARSPTLVELLDPDDGSPLDRALVTRFVAPASYTGEALVEIACHGGWLIPTLIVDACCRAGARLAEPGEFTKRAYLHGKLDLLQAEAIADLIEAKSRAVHRAALGQLDRGLSRRVSAMRSSLLRVDALLAHHVDFPEEDDAPVPLERIARDASLLIADMDAMLRTAPEGELLREGALVVFAGRPNAGKSSLYNALLGEDRAIVTDEPGTTRDALEAVVELGGFPFRLVDTAGLREAEGRVEQMGVEVARRYRARADVLLFCVAADEGMRDDDYAFLKGGHGAPIILIETKADLLTGDVHVAHAEDIEVVGRASVSVETGDGLDDLRDLLPALVYASVVSAGIDAPVLTRRRHALALASARSEVEAFRVDLVGGVPAEMAATHLRAAETALEELLGVISVDDVLDVVFQEFCVGK